MFGVKFKKHHSAAQVVRMSGLFKMLKSSAGVGGCYRMYFI